MRRFCTKFEIFDTSRILAKLPNQKDEPGRNQPGGGMQRTAREYESRGNEPKKYLKTKEVTFSNAANHVHFACEFVAISLQKEQSTAHFAKRSQDL